MKKVLQLIDDNYMMLVFLVTCVGVFASLYFSNVAGLNPCVLCWYQRILFYPIFILSAVSLAFKERLSPKFILALAIPGMLIAGYHYGIQKLGIPEADFVTCVAGTPCTNVDFQVLGFVTIPLLSFLGFFAINVLTLIKVRARFLTKFSTQISKS